MKNLLLIATVLLAITGCRKDIESNTPQQPDLAKGAVKPAATPAKRFEPEHKSTETLGAVTLNNTIYTVATEFTDAVAFKQEAVNQNGQPDVLNYREKLVHLIKTGKDTITLNKAFFKKQLPDYASMILQGALLNHKFKSGTFPLLVYFCMPDSDYCFYFDVSIGPAGKISIRQVEEDDY